MRIFVDMDGVLSDFVGGALSHFNRIRGRSLRHEDVKTFKIVDAPGFSPDDKGELDGLMCRVGFWRFLDEIPGAVAGLKKIRAPSMTGSLGHDVCIATALPGRAPESYEGKLSWLDEHGLGPNDFPRDNIITAKRKGLLMGDVLLDDGVHNLEEFKGLSVCFDQPWNQEWKGARVGSWDDFVDLISKMEPA